MLVLVLVTHDSIVVIELKNWHGQLLLEQGENWFVDGQDRYERQPGSAVVRR